MTRKEKQNDEPYWYWSTPVEGLSIEDCEQIAQESLTESRNQSTEKKFVFAVFT